MSKRKGEARGREGRGKGREAKGRGEGGGRPLQIVLDNVLSVNIL